MVVDCLPRLFKPTLDLLLLNSCSLTIISSCGCPFLFADTNIIRMNDGVVWYIYEGMSTSPIKLRQHAAVRAYYLPLVRHMIRSAASTFAQSLALSVKQNNAFIHRRNKCLLRLNGKTGVYGLVKFSYIHYILQCMLLNFMALHA